jgi:DNA-binding NarL/FixJ family response regulator
MMKVLVADDHPLFREAIVGALQGMDDDVGVIESGSISEAFDQVAGHDDLDLILLDLRMPGMSGVKGIRALRVRRPDVPIAVISALTDSFVVRECLDAGAIGYIPKSLPRAEIASAIKTILDGGSYTPAEEPGAAKSEPVTEDAPVIDEAVLCRFELLTNQQRRVLELMAQGMANKLIAYNTNVQITTVKSHVSTLLQKLGVTSRTQAVILYENYCRYLSATNRGDQSA